MSKDPFTLGGGRNGPAAQVPMLGQGKRPAAPPYRPDMSDEEFVAVGDIVVCTLAPSRETKVVGGVELAMPDQPSPFHLVLAVGPKVAEKCGVNLEPGDIICQEGSRFVDTLAGRVWFVRAEAVLSVVLAKPAAEAPVA